jgi:hypothetical protein
VKGSAGSFEAAKADFRAAWERFYGMLMPHDVAHRHHRQDVAAARTSRP